MIIQPLFSSRFASQRFLVRGKQLAAILVFSYIFVMTPLNLRHNRMVFAAPLAGVSDSAYRSIVKEMGADYAFPEMISSEGLIRDNGRTRDMMKRYDGETNVGCQLFGTNPQTMAESAQAVENQGFDSVDLNCGCPVHKVVDKNGGAALMKNPKLLGEIVSAVTRKISIPFSIKIRSGWDKKHLNYLEIGKVAEDNGAAYVTLHARTQSEFFAPEAHWEHIRELKESLSIPVVGNGNVQSAADAIRMFNETGCDGVMLASGTLGNPFIFREVKSLLETGVPIDPPATEEKVEVCLDHIRRIVEIFGEQRGIPRSRKLIGWYYRRISGKRKIPQQVFQVDTYAEIENYFREGLYRLQGDAA
jgi:nifR3 family TIM-barrel protein